MKKHIYLSVEQGKDSWFSYGTKTALYSSSRQMTHISGIRRSLIAPSDSLAGFSVKPENELQISVPCQKRICRSDSLIIQHSPSLSCPDLLAAAARTLQVQNFTLLKETKISLYDNQNFDQKGRFLNYSV